jgi:hypothetical protein
VVRFSVDFMAQGAIRSLNIYQCRGRVGERLYIHVNSIQMVKNPSCFSVPCGVMTKMSSA